MTKKKANKKQPKIQTSFLRLEYNGQHCWLDDTKINEDNFSKWQKLNPERKIRIRMGLPGIMVEIKEVKVITSSNQPIN